MIFKKLTPTIRYKFLREVDGEIRSSVGKLTWEPGEWAKVPGRLSICSQGLHCSVRMFDAFNYVPGEIVARVEVAGNHESQNNKEAWQKMRLADVRKWQKKDSVALSIYAAELCIEYFEEVFPDDNRPRLAIEAARKWLTCPTEDNRLRAVAAGSAGSDAWSAAGSAKCAARSAEDINDKINAWMEAGFDDLEKFNAKEEKK